MGLFLTEAMVRSMSAIAAFALFSSIFSHAVYASWSARFALSLQAVGLFLRARVRLRGLVALALRVLDARAQLRQIAFVDESDDLGAVFGAVLAACAGFDLTVGLHLTVGAVGVVDGGDA